AGANERIVFDDLPAARIDENEQRQNRLHAGSSRRTSSSNCAGLSGLERKPTAPENSASCLVAAYAATFAVITMTGIDFVASSFFSSRRAVNPSVTGIITSIRMSCGASRAAVSTASRPFLAEINWNPA